MGGKVFAGIIEGAVVFVGVKYLIQYAITGTDAGSQIVTNLVPLACALGLVWVTFTAFFKSSGSV